MKFNFLSQDESNRDTKGENPFPITQLLNIDERSFKQTSIRSNTSNIRYLTFHRENNSTVSDYARQRLLSPEKMADENFSVIESVSPDNVMNAAKNDVTSARNDVIIERDHHGWNMSQSKQELRTLLKNCGALDKDMASPELHRCNKEENKEFIPSYIISAGMKSDTSYNRCVLSWVLSSLQYRRRVFIPYTSSFFNYLARSICYLCNYLNPVLDLYNIYNGNHFIWPTARYCLKIDL